MKDIMTRIFVVAIMALCITILLFGAKSGQAAEQKSNNVNTYNWDWPTMGEISDHFGTRGGHHYGIDIATETGTSVHVVEDGEVMKSYYSSTYGHVIFIKHKGNIETVYAHLSKRAVQEGETVHKGQMIGLVGNTGQSYGPHLHFEVHNGEWNVEKTNAINPLVFLDETKIANRINETVKTISKNHVKKQTIVIENGDTLWALSQEYDVSVEDIKHWNQLTDDLIIVGSELTIYEKTTTTESSNLDNNKTTMRDSDEMHNGLTSKLLITNFYN